MELYYTFSVLIVLAAFFAYVNLRFRKLPSTIGIMLIAIIVSVLIRVMGITVFPETTLSFFNILLKITYFVVVFSIIIQGLTISRVAKKALSQSPSSPLTDYA